MPIATAAIRFWINQTESAYPRLASDPQWRSLDKIVDEAIRESGEQIQRFFSDWTWRTVKLLTDFMPEKVRPDWTRRVTEHRNVDIDRALKIANQALEVTDFSQAEREAFRRDHLNPVDLLTRYLAEAQRRPRR